MLGSTRTRRVRAAAAVTASAAMLLAGVAVSGTSHALDGPPLFTFTARLVDEDGGLVVDIPASWAASNTATSSTTTYGPGDGTMGFAVEDPTPGTYTLSSAPNGAMAAEVETGAVECSYWDPDEGIFEPDVQRRAGGRWEVDVHGSMHTTCSQIYVVVGERPANVNGTITVAGSTRNPIRASDFSFGLLDASGQPADWTQRPDGFDVEPGEYTPVVLVSDDVLEDYDPEQWSWSPWHCTTAGRATQVVPIGESVTLAAGQWTFCQIEATDYEVELRLAAEVEGNVEYTQGGIRGARGTVVDVLFEAGNVQRHFAHPPVSTRLSLTVDHGGAAAQRDPFLLSEGWTLERTDDEGRFVFVTDSAVAPGAERLLRLGVVLTEEQQTTAISGCLEALDATTNTVRCETVRAVADGGGDPVTPSPSPSESPTPSPSPTPDPTITPAPGATITPAPAPRPAPGLPSTGVSV